MDQTLYPRRVHDESNYDKESGTLWYPYAKGLMGIQGTYFQRWLPKIASSDTTWGKWVEQHPDTRLMH